MICLVSNLLGEVDVVLEGELDRLLVLPHHGVYVHARLALAILHAQPQGVLEIDAGVCARDKRQQLLLIACCVWSAVSAQYR